VPVCRPAWLRSGSRRRCPSHEFIRGTPPRSLRLQAAELELPVMSAAAACLLGYGTWALAFRTGTRAPEGRVRSRHFQRDRTHVERTPPIAPVSEHSRNLSALIGFGLYVEGDVLLAKRGSCHRRTTARIRGPDFVQTDRVFFFIQNFVYEARFEMPARPRRADRQRWAICTASVTLSGALNGPSLACPVWQIW